MPQKKNGDATAAMKLLALYSLLLFSGRKYSLSELAKRFHCSKQTVLRLADQIETTHPIAVKLESSVENGQRFFWAAKPDRTPDVTLDVESLQQLVLCRDLVLHMLPDGLRDEINATLTHTTVLLPKSASSKDALQPIAVAQPKGVVDYSNHHDIIETVLRCLRDRHILRVEYRNHAAKEAKAFDVAPLRLVTFRDGLYIKGRLEAALEDPSKYYDPILAVHRIQTAADTGRVFTPPELPEPHLPETFGFMPGEPFRVKVRFDATVASYVAERIWSRDQQITWREDGELTLDLTATSEQEVVSWLLGFGKAAGVISPESLRSLLRNHIQEMIRFY